jgi:myosin heavy chain 9/10/11/14
MAQQRTIQVELEDNKQQVKELTHAKKQLQAELSSAKDRLEIESLAKNEEASKKSSFSYFGYLDLC